MTEGKVQTHVFLTFSMSSLPSSHPWRKSSNGNRSWPSLLRRFASLRNFVDFRPGLAKFIRVTHPGEIWISQNNFSQFSGRRVCGAFDDRRNRMLQKPRRVHFGSPLENILRDESINLSFRHFSLFSNKRINALDYGPIAFVSRNPIRWKTASVMATAK